MCDWDVLHEMHADTIAGEKSMTATKGQNTALYGKWAACLGEEQYVDMAQDLLPRRA